MTQFNIGASIAVSCMGLWSCSGDADNDSNVSGMPARAVNAGMPMPAPANGVINAGGTDQMGGETANEGGKESDMMAPDPPIPEGPAASEVDYPAAAPPILRLTQTQIVHSLHDVFGDSITIPSVADPDMTEGGFKTVGSAVSVPSTRGVESIEKMAFAVAADVVSADKRDETIDCDPAEDGCAESFIKRRGRQLWRRPLTNEESQRLVDLFSTVKTAWIAHCPESNRRCRSDSISTLYFSKRVSQRWALYELCPRIAIELPALGHHARRYAPRRCRSRDVDGR